MALIFLQGARYIFAQSFPKAETSLAQGKTVRVGASQPEGRSGARAWWNW
jgi:hypothetical protein